MSTQDDWALQYPEAEARNKIGALGERRRVELGLSSMTFAHMVGVALESLNSFELGRGTTSGYDVSLIEHGLEWSRGAVDSVLAEVQASRLRPERIVMEHLDREDSTRVR